MDRAEWLQSLKVGDVVCTVTAKSPVRVSVKEYKIKEAWPHHVKVTGLFWNLRRDRIGRDACDYIIPNTSEAIAEETAYQLRDYRLYMAKSRLNKTSEDQLARIEAILAERKRR